VAVAEGARKHRGLIRFLLEGEGFEVVASASSRAGLIRDAGAERPDVVVLDEVVGARSLEPIRTAFPEAPIVVVSPIEPAEHSADAWVGLLDVIRDLGPTVRHLAGLEGRSPETSAEPRALPGWVERVRKDPARLRELLAERKEEAGTPEPAPSAPTLHPSVARYARGAEPVAAQASEPVAAQAEAVAEEAAEPRQLHRRVGAIALGAAAVAGAVVLGLSIGGRAPDLVRANGVPVGPAIVYPPPWWGPSIVESGEEPDGQREPGGDEDGDDQAEPTGPTTTTGPPDGGGPRPPSGEGPPGNGPGGGEHPAEPAVWAPGASGRNPHGGPPGLSEDHSGSRGGGRLTAPGQLKSSAARAAHQPDHPTHPDHPHGH
jgi:hypothetical protein